MEDMSRDLAAVLTQFQKSPGRDDKWVEKSIAAVERAWPDEHAKLGRLVNFASRLSDIAKLRDTEQSAAIVGIFFQVLSSTELDEGSPAAQPWTEYFTNNFGSFEAAYDVVKGLRTNDAEGWGGPATVVARVSVLFENENKSRRRGPLQLLHTLRDEADTPVMERVVEALWTEEGQELCSQGSRSARLSTAELASSISDGLKILKGVPARPRATTAESGTPGPLSAPIRSSSKRGASDLVASLASATSERKKALRATLIPEDDEPVEAPEAGPLDPAIDEETIAAIVTSFEEKKTRQKTTVEQPISGGTEAASEEVVGPEGPATPDERSVAEKIDEADDDLWRNAARKPTPLKKEPVMTPNNGLDNAVPEKLQALRQRLERIERSAAEAQELLTELAPQLDEVYTWVSDLDAVLSRWSRSRTAV